MHGEFFEASYQEELFAVNSSSTPLQKEHHVSNSISNGSSNPLGKHFSQEIRQRLSEDLHLTGKAKRTHDGYIRAVRQLSDFAQCSPDRVTEQHVRQFFLHLKNERNFAYAHWSLNVVGSSIQTILFSGSNAQRAAFCLAAHREPLPTPHDQTGRHRKEER